MQRFSHDGFELAYMEEGEGDPIVLVHGFASNLVVNWVSTGWVKTLVEAGYRVIALDNRGHGLSSGSHNAADYTLEKMSGDVIALLDHLAVDRAHIMGFSMGARICAVTALNHPERVGSVVLGGLGSGMVEGVGEWDIIAEALLAEDPSTITHERSRMFRTFADRTRSDRRSLAACISRSRQLLTPEQMASIRNPVLVAVGDRDDIGGDPHRLAAMLPNGEGFTIEGRDHMLSVGDKSFKAKVLEFLARHPL
jgi:Predicted hydrolases or acyltransferases (alpha/beta hydrolase superfamily)